MRVLDFGAARAPSHSAFMSESRWDETRTATPRYASCQVLGGEPADARDDLYAFACVAYVLMTGQHPFDGRTSVEAREQRARPSRSSAFTGREWRALRRGLAFDRERRPSDVAEWLAAFDLGEAPVRLPAPIGLARVAAPARRSMLVPALCLLGLALAAAGWWASRHVDAVTRTATQLGAETQSALEHSGAELTSLGREARRAAGTPGDTPLNPVIAPAPSAGEPPPTAAASPPTSAAGVPPATAEAAPPATAEAAPPATAEAAPPRPAKASPPATPQAQARDGARPRVAAQSPARPAAAAPHIEFAADTVEVPLADPAARVSVRRTGSLRGEVSFSWWTESGTAKPGKDFVPVATREEHIEDGKAGVNLFIPVVGDSTRHQPKSFYVVLNAPDSGALLGSRTLTMVTIPPSN